MKKCVILANGKRPKKSAIDFFRRIGYNTIICADGGANSANKMGLIPDFIIGDMDSSDTAVLKHFKSKSKIINIKRQNDTDVEKCLKFAIKNKYKKAVLLGVTGDRLDHSFCNLGIVLKFFDKIEINIAAENSYLKAYTGEVELASKTNETISLYGFDRKTKITSSGLKYSLKETALPFGEKESTSNVSIAAKVKLKIKGGKIFVIRDFNFMKNHDLF